MLRFIPEHSGQFSAHPLVFEINFLLTFAPDFHVNQHID